MILRQKLLSMIPDRVRRRVVIPVVHQIGAALMDAGGWILGDQDALTPPRRLQRGGTGEFSIGYQFLRHFTELGGLKPDHAVLDIGCGVGRMAVPLTGYITTGSYRGIDIVARGVHWCNGHITPRFPNFQFQTADIFNESYNPNGRQRAASYRFPYDDAAFDFIFLTSVFTHLVPDDTEQYLREIGRMLKPGGRLFGTWFLLNEESRQSLRDGRAVFDITRPYQGREDVLVQSEVYPEDAIAFEEGLVRRRLAESGMNVVEPIHYGSWSGRAKHLSFQDILIAQKQAA